MDRRSILKSTSAALGGALAAGCASVGADGATRSPFKVASVTLPIVGSTDVFPVMKVNQFCRIPTDQYPYHFLTSLFFRRENPTPLQM